MKVGQYMLNPAIVGAGIGASIGTVQKYGHDSDQSITETALTGAGWGLGLGATYVATRTAFTSKKVGQLTNPFRTKMDTTGMSADQIKALQMWGSA